MIFSFAKNQSFKSILAAPAKINVSLFWSSINKFSNSSLLKKAKSTFCIDTFVCSSFDNECATR
jgi:hypothetical protein